MPLDVELVRVLAVVGGHRPEPVGREELALVEELAEQPLEPVDADDAEQQSPVPGRAPEEPELGELLPVVAGPRRSRNPGKLLPTRSTRSSIASSMTPAASIGMMPTIERTLTGTAVPSGATSRS